MCNLRKRSASFRSSNCAISRTTHIDAKLSPGRRQPHAQLVKGNRYARCPSLSPATSHPLIPMPTTLPDHLTPAVRAALTDALAALPGLYGDRLRHVVLYGSQVRGEAHRESDVDVLVVLDGEVDFVAEIRRLLSLKMEALARYEILLSLKPIPLATYQNHGHPLMINVHQEGAVLA